VRPIYIERGIVVAAEIDAGAKSLEEIPTLKP